MQTVLAGGAGLSLARFASADNIANVQAGVANLPERPLELFNTHTSENLRLVFKRGLEFDAPTLARFNHLLRDHRNDEVHEIDPRLFDQLHALAVAAHCEPRFEIISGFRSQESNNKMSAKPGSGVAKKSLHMQGRALDVRLKGCPCSDLRDLALAAKQGGVGYYHRSDFVHIDTGAFRSWAG
ncbi:MAG TPA: DUF882 domain-containing protein [Steroidobacteraceae bacterium]|nr:DUF882 domain-containing protein [Steroidobacteraceae bacterium]